MDKEYQNRSLRKKQTNNLDRKFVFFLRWLVGWLVYNGGEQHVPNRKHHCLITSMFKKKILVFRLENVGKMLFSSFRSISATVNKIFVFCSPKFYPKKNQTK